MSTTTTMDTISEWLRANGLDPNRVPQDAEIYVDHAGGTITAEQYLTDEQGRLVVRGDSIVRTVITVPLKTMPAPDLIAGLHRYNIEERIRRDTQRSTELAAARRELADLRERHERMTQAYEKALWDNIALNQRIGAVADAAGDHTRLCRLRTRITALLAGEGSQ